ncbi:conserved hypothetical protein [Talaromyces stipitatus ATCC 10500]|uniref:Rhodopsin domain-containing protein n=1 Tax=Talaromyces stipitatus (strain ATCC 10500 / CBS 375.48 / QM 6759 / NRRL 1006) TaxID=441959 RepID=B8MR78_TALSN|nr:uncharacterized protein TSTA_054820 [Talaromyces stipitatus ATCC 10500]EED12972.1 conserved hypothetical protein [Talaromyces stipitatus ATCC 10500]
MVYDAVVSLVMANHGGEHAWDINHAQGKDALYWFNIASVVYGFVICLTKLSVLFLYRRVFSPVRWSAFDCTIVALIAIMTSFYISTCIVKIMQCTPRAKIWDSSVHGTCINEPALLNTSGFFNTITDYTILILPVHAVLRLQLSRMKKILVVLVFTFGLCAPIFSTVGLVVRFRISGSPDITWNEPEILLWGAAEITSGFLIVCFPEMSFLINRKSRRYYSHHHRPTLELSSSTGAGQSRTNRPRKMAGSSHHHDDLTYYELDDDIVYGVRVSPSGSNSRLHEPANGTVQVHHEITIECNKKEEVVTVNGQR